MFVASGCKRGKLGAATFAERAGAALSNLAALQAEDPLRLAFLDKLKLELEEFIEADKKEDQPRLELQSGSDKTALFTIPWRKTSKATRDATPASPATETTP
ncbi:hypothetical protein [Polyangium fumosum]|uniref:Uncharacterized protein n=1 Tax=Polyangium fumosum TaxID=889272 RepID=A0A4U1ISE2_9BACT|nr:hypothetical protein [Polyangium fumosum]TKC97255.1 hypothetical protein E8A74_43865 [Polyangium fumosum]